MLPNMPLRSKSLRTYDLFLEEYLVAKCIDSVVSIAFPGIVAYSGPLDLEADPMAHINASEKKYCKIVILT